MAFKNFSDFQYMKYMDTSEVIKLGSFKLGASNELHVIRLATWINGTLGGSEQLKFNIYSDPAINKLIFSSAWIDINGTIEDENDQIITGDWFGLLKFSFNRQNINKNLTYYGSIEARNYTRNGSTFHLAFPYDYPSPRYATGATAFYDANIAFEVYGYE